MIGMVAEAWRERPERAHARPARRLLRLWVEPRRPGSPACGCASSSPPAQPGPEGSAMKLTFARLNQELSGLELELLGEDGLRYDDWTMRRPDDVDFTGRVAGLPVPAGQGQLDRGRHLGDPAQHHRRAGARPARRAARRQGRPLEGPAPMSDPLTCSTPTSRSTLRDDACAPAAPTAARPDAVLPALDERPRRIDRGAVVWQRWPPRSGWPACRCRRRPAAPAPRPRGRRRAGGARPRRRARAVPDQRGARHHRAAALPASAGPARRARRRRAHRDRSRCRSRPCARRRVTPATSPPTPTAR